MDSDFEDPALRTAAGRVRAIRIDQLVRYPDNLDDDQINALIEAVEDGTGSNPRAADPVLRAQAERLAGCLIQAGDAVAEILGADVEFIRAGARVADRNDDRIDALWQLPERFAHRYDAVFAQRFLDAYRDLIARLREWPWQPPSSVAQELGLRLLLNRAEVYIDLYEIEVADDWRSRVEDLLFLDLDHDLLYDPALDGFEEDPDFMPDLRLLPMRFEAWFDPFEPGRLPAQHRSR
jgi:hypothetical protein